MSKIALIVPASFTVESGKVEPHFAIKAGCKRPHTYGYLMSISAGWKVGMNSDENPPFVGLGLTTELLTHLLYDLPNCALLVSPHDADEVEALLREIKHEVEVIPYEGSLKTGS